MLGVLRHLDYSSTPGYPSGREKPPIDLVQTFPAAGGPLMLLPIAKAEDGGTF